MLLIRRKQVAVPLERSHRLRFYKWLLAKYVYTQFHHWSFPINWKLHYERPLTELVVQLKPVSTTSKICRPCFVCRKCYFSIGKMKGHLHKVHSNKQYCFLKDGKKFKSEGSLTQHLQSFYSIPIKSSCKECNKVFVNFSILLPFFSS